jgi:biotin synthase-like enzyme
MDGLMVGMNESVVDRMQEIVIYPTQDIAHCTIHIPMPIPRTYHQGNQPSMCDCIEGMDFNSFL